MEIECKFTAFSSEHYSCRVTEASITEPNIAVISFKGIHRPGKSNNDVTRIDFAETKVEYFPRNLQKIFPNLKVLLIVDCGLKVISREDLIGLESLVALNLRGNQLKTLPDDLFSNMPNLDRVYLDRNKVEFASSKLIEPLIDVEVFDLKGNTSINEYYYLANRRSYGCRTIQELMRRIDEKCKPPKLQKTPKTARSKPHVHQLVSKAFPLDSSRSNASEEILKSCNELRLLGRFTDFVIVVGAIEFPVNKMVLAAHSSVLAKMLEVKTNGRFASKLEISDLSAEAVATFLDYLYGRKQPDAQNAAEIFQLAAKYEVTKLKTKLKTICEKIIMENLDESNAYEIFKFACGPHKSEELKVAAFAKLQENFGGELDDVLMNHPDQLQEIVETKTRLDEAKQLADDTKKLLDDLMAESRAKKQRLM